MFLKVLLALALPQLSTAATHVVAPGDYGSVDLVVENSIDSDQSPLEDVRISTVAPGWFWISSSSLLGPVTIEPGSSHTFVLNYEIAPGAPNGEFEVDAFVVMTASADVEWNPPNPDFTLQFLVAASSPRVNTFVETKQVHYWASGTIDYSPQVVMIEPKFLGFDDPGPPVYDGSLFLQARSDIPITRVRVNKPGTHTEVIVSTRDYAGSFDVTEAGDYEIIVEDENGLITQAPFKTGRLAAFVCGNVSTSHIPDTDEFTISNPICLESTVGLSEAEQYSGGGGSILHSQGFGGSTNAEFSSAELESTGNWPIVVYDQEGNVFQGGVQTATKSVMVTGLPININTEIVTTTETVIVDLRPDHVVPGARVPVDGSGAILEHTFDIAAATTPVEFVGEDFPIVSTRTIGRLIVQVYTGPSTGSLTAANAVDGLIRISSSGVLSFPPVASVALDRFVKIKAQIVETYSNDVFEVDCSSFSNPPLNTQCAEGIHIREIGLTSQPGATILGQSIMAGYGGLQKLIPAGGSTTVDLSGGVAVLLPSHGQLSASHWMAGPPVNDPRMKFAPAVAHSITLDGSLSGAVDVTLPFDATGLSTAQVQNLEIYESVSGGDYLQITQSRGASTITGRTTRLGAGAVQFIVAAPTHSTPTFVTNDGLLIVSNEPDVTQSPVSANSPDIQPTLAYIRSQGYMPVDDIYLLGPTGKTFDEAAFVEMLYSASQVEALGMSPSGLRIFQFDTQKNFEDLTAYRGSGKVTAEVSKFHSYFAVFGATTPQLGADALEPGTTIYYLGQADTSGATHFIATTTRVGFVASDNFDEGFTSSGVKETLYAFNGGALSVYSGTFTLTAGTYTVTYFSRDFALNDESTRTVTVIVTSAPLSYDETAGATLAIRENGGNFFSVVSKIGYGLRLAAWSSSGAELGNTALPAAAESDARWSLAFDGSNNVYAVGSSSGVDTHGLDLAVYKISPEGVLLATAAVSVTGASHEFAFDSTGDLWITGGYGPSEGPIQLGLWRYEMSTGQLSLKGSYSRGGGFDAGFGVQVGSTGFWLAGLNLDPLGVLAAPSVWVAGYSANPETGKLDLGLWVFTSTGGIAGGPIFRPSFLSSYEQGPTGRLLRTDDGYFIAARAEGGSAIDLAFLKYDLQGQLISDRRWRRSSPSNETPGAIGAVGGGSVGVAGSAVWTFGSDGTLQSAENDSSAGFINGFALTNNLWVGVSNSSIPRVFNGTSLSGTEIIAYGAEFAGALSPSTGAIGIAFTVAGSGFGQPDGSNTRVLFGNTTAPVTLWSDTSIHGYVPGISTGIHTVLVQRQHTSTMTTVSVGSFTAQIPTFAGISKSSGPLGTAVTLSGWGFDAFAGTHTLVLFGVTSASVTSWSNGSIGARVPNVSSGSWAVTIERRTPDGGVMATSSHSFLTVLPEPAGFSPSSGPIGTVFTVNGVNFGDNDGANTRVLFGDTTAYITLWNDTTVNGTVPGSLSTGTYETWFERASPDGVYRFPYPGSFEVVMPVISTLTPAFGEVESAFTLTGAGFGAYQGSASKVKMDGVECSLSSWNDTTIQAIVPASMSVGTYPVVVHLAPQGGSMTSESAEFSVESGNGFFSMAARSSARPDWHYAAGLKLRADEGGRVVAPSRASVSVPAGAMDEDHEITIALGSRQGKDKEQRERALGAASLSAAGDPMEFGLEGATFRAPVIIELPYDPLSLPTGAERLVAVHHWNRDKGAWEPLASEIDEIRRRVRARTDHFSLYQVLVPGGAALAAGLEFALREAYAFPNPARPGQRPAFRVDAGSAESVEVRVYDVSGRLVHSSSQIGPRLPFELPWDVGSIGSGVYYYTITAKKAGHSDLRKLGKVAVIK